MKKEEILRRARQEGDGEYEERIQGQIMTRSALVVVGLCAAFWLVRASRACLIEVRNYVRGEIVKPKSVEVKIEKRSTKKLDNIRKQNNSDGKLFQWVVNKFNNLIGKDKKKVRDRIRSRRKDD